MSSILKFCLLAAVLLLSTGCEKYMQRPLQSEQIILSVERSRHLPDAANPSDLPADSNALDALPKAAPVDFTLSRAVELMKTHSPALKEARAEYDTAQALAQVKTPLPNPVFEAGPQYGFGQDIGHLYRLQPFGSLSFAIPTGQRLKRQDELNCALAGMSWVEIQAKHRELYLELRKNYTRLVLGYQRVEKRRQLAESARKSTELSKKLIEAGFATALDSGLIELEQTKLQAEIFTAEMELSNVRGDLAQTLGVHAEHFEKLPAAALPVLPAALPPLADLQKMLADNHPELARLRAKYEIAERELHLEIARQYPDFRFGSAYDHERGERKTTIGLKLGIDLPVFDRNQQAIATAKQKREEVRTKYEAAANRALAALDRAYANGRLASEKLKLLNTVVLPRATTNLDLARKALEVGQSDSLKFLETERSQRGIVLDVLDTELTLRSAWTELEQAVGYPLTAFPNENVSEIPTLK